MAKRYKPVVLAVLDGFGVNVKDPQSTWKYASMPTLRNLEKFFPFTTLQASGIAVGLPWGEEGNSEVGHLTMGAGRAFYHHLPRIIMSIHDGSFFQNDAFLGAARHAKEYKSNFHIMGLFSSGSVHAYADHLYALLDFCKKENIPHVYVHIITDGKDAPAKESLGFIKQLEERLASRYPFAKIASLFGRVYAMDRDGHWDRIEKAYRCLTEGAGEELGKASDYIAESYEKELTDEFINPGHILSKESLVRDTDAMVVYNFREDSMRELVSSFVSNDFKNFPREKINNLFFVTMTEYEKNFPAHVAFPPLGIKNPLARVLSESNLRQLHIAETEKYAHVTYFFNGGYEAPFKGEDRILIPSPPTAHFDETPEMSAEQVADTVISNLSKYDFILVNFSNADMVGHTGNFQATVRALEVLDFSLGKIVSKVLETGGALVITADHGNAEEKIYPISGEKRTKHTANPVPFFVIANDLKNENPKTEKEILSCYKEVTGVLTDVAPTILALLDIPKPYEMTGANILPKII